MSTLTRCTDCGTTVNIESTLAGQEVRCPGCGRNFVPPAPGLTPPGLTPSRSTSVLAIVSLALSVSTLLGFGPIGLISGIICGHLAKAELRKHPTMEGEGFATAGLAVGYGILALTLVAVLIVLAILAAVFIGLNPW